MTLVSWIYVFLLGFIVILLSSKWYFHNLIIPFRILLAIVILSFVLEICTAYLFDSLDNNLFFYHIFNPLEFMLYSFLFISLSMSGRINKMISILAILFVPLALYLSLFVQKTNVNNSYEVITESLLVIFYCLLYLRHLNVNEIAKRAEKNPF